MHLILLYYGKDLQSFVIHCKQKGRQTIMKKITFKYADALSNWQWKTQSCVVSSVTECIKIYGLGIDCEYEILSVEDIE